jgi:predicted GIY-YIG superfamily endonuclease
MPWRDMRHYPYGRGRVTVYLLHFSRPLGHARHYLGQTERDVEERVREHRAGRGARLCRRAVEAGIELVLARVWEDAPRCYEQKLKNRGGFKRLCPICRAEALASRTGRTDARVGSGEGARGAAAAAAE